MTIKAFFAALLLALPALAWAQAPGEGRGSVPPGTATDGSRPADGAIKGGTILPGETGGMPDRSPLPAERIRRCDELGGMLREECLRKERDASIGSGTPTPASDGTKLLLPPDAPPPQNPR